MTNHSNGLCVIITAYNAAETITQAIESALCQPEVIEVIVVDDASSDQTTKVAQLAGKGDSRLKVIQLDSNAGPAAARNRAIADSQAPLIAILDADDYLLPTRVTPLVQRSEWDLIADNIVFVSENRTSPVTRAELPVATSKEALAISIEGFIRGNIPSKEIVRGELGFLKPIISRAFLEKHDLRYDETLRLGEDYDLYLRMLARGARFQVIADVGYVARVRPTSLSGQHSGSDLMALYEATRLHARLPLEKGDDEALSDYLAKLKARALLHRFLEIKREFGHMRALAFSLSSLDDFRIIVRGVFRDKLQQARKTATPPIQPKRFLLPLN